MKNYFILTISSILILGFVVICLPHFIFSQKEKEGSRQEPNYHSDFSTFESTVDTIEQLDIPNDELETGISDSKQIQIRHIEILYAHFTFNQADKIQEAIQFYLNNTFENIVTCTISFSEIDNDNYKYIIGLNDNGNIAMTIAISKNNEITDIIFSQSYSIQNS